MVSATAVEETAMTRNRIIERARARCRRNPVPELPEVQASDVLAAVVIALFVGTLLLIARLFT